MKMGGIVSIAEFRAKLWVYQKKALVTVGEQFLCVVKSGYCWLNNVLGANGTWTYCKRFGRVEKR